MDYYGGAAVAEERVGAVAQSYVVVLEFCIGLTIRVDDEVLHVASVVAFGILQAVLLAIGIEMRAGRLEVGGIALGVLVEVDGVLAGREIVQVKLKGNT